MVKDFIDKNPEFELAGFESLIHPEQDMETLKDGYVELFPHIHHTDGFFIAKIRKKDR